MQQPAPQAPPAVAQNQPQSQQPQQASKDSRNCQQQSNRQLQNTGQAEARSFSVGSMSAGSAIQKRACCSCPAW